MPIMTTFTKPSLKQLASLAARVIITPTLQLAYLAACVTDSHIISRRAGAGAEIKNDAKLELEPELIF